MILKEINCYAQDHAPVKWQSQNVKASVTDRKVCSLHIAVFSTIPFSLFLSLISMSISKFLSFYENKFKPRKLISIFHASFWSRGKSVL